MTNVNPNLRTFSDMYKSGFQPLFVPLTPGGSAPAQYSPQGGPVLQPQPGQDSVEVGGKKKMSKGKKAALAGLAIAATVAAAATAIHFLGGKGTPSEVRKAAKLAQSFVGEAETAVSDAEKLARAAAEDLTKAQSTGVGEIKGVQDAAKDVLNTVKEKVDIAMNLFNNGGKNDAGDVVAKFFSEEGVEITDAAGRMANGVTMRYASPSAAEELVEAVFNSGRLDSITESTKDGGVLRNIFRTDMGFMVNNTVEALGDSMSNIAERFIFKGSLDKPEAANLSEFFQNIVVGPNGAISAGKSVLFDSQSAFASIQEGIRFFDDDGTPNTLVEKIIDFNQGAGGELKVSGILNGYNANANSAARVVKVNDAGKLDLITTLEALDDGAEVVEAKLVFDDDNIPSSFHKATRNAEKTTNQRVVYNDGEMSSYRVSEKITDADDASKQIKHSYELEFGEDTTITNFVNRTDKMDGSEIETATLEFKEGAPVRYQEEIGDKIEKEFDLDPDSGKWVDPNAPDNNAGGSEADIEADDFSDEV